MTDEAAVGDLEEETELKQEEFPRVPVCWPALIKSEQKAALEGLREWTGWLVRRYALDQRTVPPCWAEHGALIEELSALHTAWARAFAVSAAPDQPLRWHNDFALARRRLADWVSRTGCRIGEHRSDPMTVNPEQAFLESTGGTNA
jgi:hypothetical protein